MFSMEGPHHNCWIGFDSEQERDDVLKEIDRILERLLTCRGSMR